MISPPAISSPPGTGRRLPGDRGPDARQCRAARRGQGGGSRAAARLRRAQAGADRSAGERGGRRRSHAGRHRRSAGAGRRRSVTAVPARCATARRDRARAGTAARISPAPPRSTAQGRLVGMAVPSSSIIARARRMRRWRPWCRSRSRELSWTPMMSAGNRRSRHRSQGRGGAGDLRAEVSGLRHPGAAYGLRRSKCMRGI